ncbi:class I SAM-dependent methyltransferase [Nocardioides perillae]|uniref:Ubiquinone/menaquinone biosynthesis C-methylase UbiE n=1 Tax=Nocardioides perillae TaxID=1119534 RepID=A0A7Y9RUJ0_9ACTN|nr:class I SAM-dependent methyltransferase [Nocardioides perillae]NYG54863.1 ubiquinone/menaquinone biosynthesis C-methylase UbiE [Nocardioides perillae]
MTARHAEPEAAGSPVHAAGVPDAFDGVASTYDLMVALNPGYHRHLRQSAEVLVEALRSRPRPAGRPLRVVDLGCGSGASTAALVAALVAGGLARNEVEVVGVDGSAGMLAQARRKRWDLPVRWVQADAEHLTAAQLGLDGAGVDGVLSAYLFRNVAARDRLLACVRDLLVPGGSVVVHEYSVREDRLARAKWDVVCWGVVVPLGLLTAPRSGIYRYLWRSVLDFDGAEEFRSRMVAAGLTGVRSRTFGGWQREVLHTFHARRPEAPRAEAG